MQHSLLLIIASLTFLFGCESAPRNQIISESCQSERELVKQDVRKAYEIAYQGAWDTPYDQSPLFIRECGDQVLVYFKVPPNAFGGSTYIYFDASDLAVIQIHAFQ